MCTVLVCTRGRPWGSTVPRRVSPDYLRPLEVQHVEVRTSTSFSGTPPTTRI